jgi:2,4-dienoyl-CoA reductase (NADPH2)
MMSWLEQPVTCLVNALAGAEGKLPMAPVPRKKKILVIGGGPAGMEAARVAALRGLRFFSMRRRIG